LSRRFKGLESQQAAKKQDRKNISGRSVFRHKLSRFGCE
jgi:hypothetical protein